MREGGHPAGDSAPAGGAAHLSRGEDKGACMTEEQGQKTLLVVDESPIFRQALSQVLKQKGIFSTAIDTGSAEKASSEIASRRLAMVILDLALPNHKALELLREVKELQPQCKGIILLQGAHNDELMAAIRLEADGFLTKKHTVEEMVSMVERVLSGQMVISDSLTNVLALTLRNGGVEEEKNVDCLTSREQEVLGYIASGLSNKAIASRLSITDGTVKVHVKHMLKKLGFRSRVEAAVWASERGVRTPGSEPKKGA